MHAPIPVKLKLAATATLTAILIMAAMLLHGAAGEANSQAVTLTAQVPENSSSGTSLGTPLQTTAGTGTATYSLSGPDAALFSINPGTGEITLAAGTAPDFEAKQEYSVTVAASAELTVQVTNVDEPGNADITTTAHTPESRSRPRCPIPTAAWKTCAGNGNGRKETAGTTSPTQTEPATPREQTTSDTGSKPSPPTTTTPEPDTRPKQPPPTP